MRDYSYPKGTPQNPYTREDVEAGLPTQHIEQRKVIAQNSQKAFEDSLNTPHGINKLYENGTDTDKIRAFNYLHKKPIQPIQPKVNFGGNDTERKQAIQNMIDKG